MALTKVTGDFIKDGVLTQAHLHTSHGITTAHIGEGSNLYFTNARVDSRIGDLSTSNLSEGSNLYYTDARARGAISVSGNALSYNSSTGVITSNFEESPTFTGAVVGASFSAAGGFLNGSNGGIRIHSSGTKFFNITAANAARDGVMDIGASDARFKDLYLSGNITAGGNITASGDIVAPGIYVGSANTSYDFYNNGTTYLNGTVTVDADLNFTAGDFNVGGVRIVGDNDSADQGTAFIRSNGDYLVMNAADGEHVYLNWDSANGGSGHVYIDNALYAQIFHDRNDTNYYLNPNGNSVLSTANFATVQISAGSSYNENIRMFPGSNGYSSLILGAATGSSGTGTGQWSLVRFPSSSTYKFTIRHNSTDHVTIATAGNVTNHVDTRSPIYYDSNDTARYVDPTSLSRLNSLEIANTSNKDTPGALMKIGSDGFIFGGNNSGYESNSAQISAGYHTANSLNFVGMGTSSSNRRMDFWAEGGFYVSGVIYDKDSTSYYLDPANGDRALKTNGSVSIGTVGHLGLGDTSHPKVVYPGKEASWDGSGSTTGAIVITLPGTLANYDMMYMEIDIYEYSGDNGSKIIIGGHNWNSGGNGNTSAQMWHNTGIKVIGSFNKPVYFGWRNDGTNNRRVIVLGETNSSWSYGTVHVSKVSGACYYADSIDWMGDWVVAQTTSSSYYTKNPTTNFNAQSTDTLQTYGYMKSYGYRGNGNVGGTGAASWHPSGIYSAGYNWLYGGCNFNGGSLTNAGDMRANIFYDNNDTSYYLDPNSTTSLKTVGAWRANSSNWDGEFNGKIQHHGNYWYMQSANGILVRNSSGANNVTLAANGVCTAANDWRAPQFYDSADTNYIIDPNGTSLTRSISIMQGSGLNLYQSGNGSYAYQDARAEGSYSAVYKGTNNGSAYGEYREYWYDGDSYHSLRIAGNRFDFNAPLTVATDVRAPIFYDSNDTAYYVNPAGNSNVNTINSFGFSQQGGASKILVTASNGYLQLNNWMHVDGAGIYSGVNGAHFYPNQSSDYGAWRIQGTRNGWTGITFEVSGYYQNVMANANTIGFYNDTENEWMVECQRNSHTRLYYNGSEQAKTDNGYFSINNALHSPITYDSNNTGFYSDPASTTRLDSIMLRSTINFPVNSPGVTHGSGHRPAYGIYQEGGAWSSPFPDLCIAMHTGIKLGANASYNGIRFYTDYTMATRVMAVNDSSSPAGSSNVYVDNTLLTGSSLRAPIFYDSNNTTYYTRPGTSSLINTLYTAGTIQAGTSGVGNIYLGNNGGNGTGNHFRFHTNNSHTYFDGNCGDIHWRQGSSTRFYFYMTSANMTINGTLTQNSDERIKENIVEIPNALEKIDAMRGVYYNRTDINTEVKKIGVIAQEVETVLPEVILEAPDTGLKSVAYAELTAVLINGIKEQQVIIDDLKARIEILENQ